MSHECATSSKLKGESSEGVAGYELRVPGSRIENPDARYQKDRYWMLDTRCWILDIKTDARPDSIKISALQKCRYCLS